MLQVLLPLQKNIEEDVKEKLVNSIVEVYNNSYNEELNKKAKNVVQYKDAIIIIKKDKNILKI